jgi:hypothetical protein
MGQPALQTTIKCTRCGGPLGNITYTDLVGGYYCDADCMEMAETREPVPLDKRVAAAWHDDEQLAGALENLLANIVTQARREECQGELWPHELEEDDRARQFCAAIRSLPDDHPLIQIARRAVREWVENA